MVLAQTFVALPFLVVSLEGALRSAGSRYEAVAATLGARPTTVLRRVTLPLVLPGLASGAVLSFARSLGEFGATLTFAGSLQGVTRTLPLEIYLQRETDADAAVALSLLLVVVAVVVVGLSYRGPAPAGSGGRTARDAAHARAGAGMTFTLDAALAARRFDVSLSLAPGETVAVLGPERGREIHPALRGRRAAPPGHRPGRGERPGAVRARSRACTPGPRRTAAAPPCWPRIRCCFRT